MTQAAFAAQFKPLRGEVSWARHRSDFGIVKLLLFRYLPNIDQVVFVKLITIVPDPGNVTVILGGQNRGNEGFPAVRVNMANGALACTRSLSGVN